MLQITDITGPAEKFVALITVHKCRPAFVLFRGDQAFWLSLAKMT
jgi:hypothetical protein